VKKLTLCLLVLILGVGTSVVVNPDVVELGDPNSLCLKFTDHGCSCQWWTYHQPYIVWGRVEAIK